MRRTFGSASHVIAKRGMGIVTACHPNVARAKALTIHCLLLDAYGEPAWHPHADPVSQIVSTILSQSTTDANRDTAYRRLRERFPTWEAVRRAPVEEVEEAIRPAGLAAQRSPRIQAALNQIAGEQGELSLDFLKEMSVAEATTWLTRIRGVGPKTAAIVLLFSLGMPAFPWTPTCIASAGGWGWHR